ncbi:MAG: sodium:proton exchanger [Rhodothermaceae bacterium]|nr:sodium:proton exchanger [Rhodothermaceae bacterium]
MAAAPLPFLGELAALFAASVGVAYLCYRLRLVPIVGFLLAGVLIGPGALGLVQDETLIQQAAEVGVILLLFTIGIEFSLEKLARIRRLIVVGGGLQVVVTVGLVTLALVPFGVSAGTAVFTGCLVALSSTAIVLGLLSERRETDTPAGRAALGVLIFQDLAIVLMVLLVPILGGTATSAGEIAWALGKAALVIVLVIVLARRVIPPLLDVIARTRRPELFLMAVLALCLGTAWLTGLAGVSLALGAFLAGLLVSESPYSHHALSEVLPLQTVFAAVFFVSIGMLLDPAFLVAYLPWVLGIAAVVLLLKLAVTAGSILVLHSPVRTAVHSGLALAQIGEFSFVLAIAGAAVGLTPAGLGEVGSQGFIAVTVLLMLATPFLVQGAPRFGMWLERRLPMQPAPDAPETGGPPLEDHVIIVGYGPAGQRLAQVLRNTGIPFLVMDLNPQSVGAARAEGLDARFGDAARRLALEEAHLDRAKLLVVAINDPAATERAVHLARHLNPTLQILVRARYLAEIGPLEAAGADIVIPEELEAAVRLFVLTLQAYLVPPEEVDRQVSLIRTDDYAVLRGSIQEAHLMVLQGLDEEGLHTRAVAVREGASAAQRTLAELALRPRHGLTVLAVRRGRSTLASPAGDFRVEAGDRLVLIGMAESFAAAAPLFRASADESA